MATADSRRLLIAIRAYEPDHGQNPVAIQELYPRYIDTKELLVASHPKTGETTPYLYYPENDKGHEILLVNPWNIYGKFAVGYAGGHVDLLDELPDLPEP